MQEFLLFFVLWNMAAMVDSHCSVAGWRVGGRLTECHVNRPCLSTCEKVNE